MKYLLPVIAVAISACSGATSEPQNKANDAGASAILSQSDVAESKAPWGSFFPYYTQDTHVLKPVLVGVAKIEAGKEIHPPHRHADEEYLMITKGRGTWYLNGKESPAKEGDILFSRAWDYHGIRAAEDSPLEFVVFKYSGRKIEAPTDPQPELPEELGG